jgi:hypothetical protein
VKGEVVEYPAFAPLLIAAVRQQPFALQLLSRSIIIHMESHVEGRDEIDPNDPGFVPVRTALLHWAPGFQRPKICELPRELVGRAANNWGPLIEIGDALGYPATVRAVARAMCSGTSAAYASCPHPPDTPSMNWAGPPVFGPRIC